MKYQETEGDLIALAKAGEFNVIAHGCNCFCTMGAGIAPQMARAFGVDTLPGEHPDSRGDIRKLGNIEWKMWGHPKNLIVVNAYTQYGFGRNHSEGTEVPLDYEALTMCMRKINYVFKGKHIGLPRVGCGLAGGIWDSSELPLNKLQALPFGFKDVKTIIQTELKDCDITIVNYKP